MNSNKNELPEFIQQMSVIDVDYIILRRLIKKVIKKELNINGFIFDYAKEILSDEEFGKCAESALKIGSDLGIKIIDQNANFIFEGKRGNNKSFCSDPWETAYCLSYGIAPCCYGYRIASWSDKKDDVPLIEFIKETFNGPIMQDIRAHLAKGEFSEYCLNQKSCPVISACGKSYN